MKKVQDLHFSSKGLTSFFMLQYDKFLIAIFVVIIGVGFYVIYSLTYATLIIPKEIDPSEINVEQETIKIDRYNKTITQLEKKTQVNNSATTPQITQ